MKRILIVEDDCDAARVNGDFLKEKGYDTLHAPNLKLATMYLRTEKIDLILMDILLRDGNGLDYTRIIRREKIMTPLIFMTVCTHINEIKAGFELGCEDYLKKPVSLDELLLRVKRVLGDMNSAAAFFRKIGKYRFNPLTQCLHFGEDVQQLGTLESSVLNELSAINSETVLKEVLLEKYWFGASVYSSRNLDSTIVKLRKRFKKDPQIHIISLKRCGYRLVVD